MSKFKSINKYSSEWDAHINKATASPQFAKQYKSTTLFLMATRLPQTKSKTMKLSASSGYGDCAQPR